MVENKPRFTYMTYITSPYKNAFDSLYLSKNMAHVMGE
jgi:hypothetical protein